MATKSQIAAMLAKKWHLRSAQTLVLISVILFLPQLSLLQGGQRNMNYVTDTTLHQQNSVPPPPPPLQDGVLSTMAAGKVERLLPTPILVVGMPKTGTSSVHAFFERSGYRSSHYRCINHIYCGLCMKVAVQAGSPPLKSCGDYEVWAQMDVENLGQCYFPQIHNLEVLHQEAPNATLLLTYRNMTHWAKSVRNWVGGVRSMAARLAKCDGGPISKGSEDLIEWHLAHIERIRRFAKDHPSHALVEIDIENPNAGKILEAAFGSATSANHWGHENDSVERAASRTKTRED